MKNDTKHSADFWVIIPAAGISQRMCQNNAKHVPKQYLPLLNTTVIQASLSSFFKHPKISAIVVALHAEDQSWEELSFDTNKPIHTVIGGDCRTSSVENALVHVMQEADENDFVLVHDAARPCLTYTDLNLLIEKLEQDHVGGILATPVSDTVKQANAVDEVICTVDRSNLWKALTPQMFRAGVLSRALDHCHKNSIDVTDEASAVEALGLDVKLIQGRNDNIKITHAEDVIMAEMILQQLHQKF